MEQKKRKQIKTIRAQLHNYESFDELVNEALRDGWYLDKRYTLPARVEGAVSWLVAELQRYVENE